MASSLLPTSPISLSSLQVFAFLVFIPAAVLHTNVGVDPAALVNANLTTQVQDAILPVLSSTDTGAEWIIVVCWAAIFSQVLALFLRFINLELVERYIGLVLIVVSQGCVCVYRDGGSDTP